MRKGIAVLIIALMYTGQLALAQKITVKKKEARLPVLFKEIRRQSGYDFLYNEQVMKDLKPVSIDVKDASIEQALDSAFSDLPLKYAIQDKLVMITAKDTPSVPAKPYRISGMVRDKKGLPLPGASVYISNYKIGTSADNKGRYLLEGLNPGTYTILVKMIGYQPASQSVMIIGRSIETDIFLDESVKELDEIVVRPDIHREARLRTFKESFLGTSRNAKKCTILNPDAIWFDYDAARHVLSAGADEFLVIENKSLGYRIFYLLEYFQKNEETSYVHFYGYPFFEELEKNESRRKKYLKRRQLAYDGSPQHFFTSIYHNTSKMEGFLVNKMIKSLNPERPPDELIDKRIKLFSENLRKGIKVRKARDSVRYWLNMKKEPDTVELLVRKEVNMDSLIKQQSDHLKIMSFKDALYIVYQNEKETAEFMKHPEYHIKRPDDLRRSQVSLMYQLSSPVGFYENGGLNDPGALLYEGMWAYEMVGDMLPLDYLNPDHKTVKE